MGETPGWGCDQVQERAAKLSEIFRVAEIVKDLHSCRVPYPIEAADRIVTLCPAPFLEEKNSGDKIV